MHPMASWARQSGSHPCPPLSARVKKSPAFNSLVVVGGGGSLAHPSHRDRSHPKYTLPGLSGGKGLFKFAQG